MEELSAELLSDVVYRLYNELEDGMKYFLQPPYTYPNSIVDEVINIVDRLDILHTRLCDIDYSGSFRYKKK